MGTLLELEPCGPSLPPRQRPDRGQPWWSPRRATAVLAVVAAVVTTVSLLQGDPPLPPQEQAAERLAEIAAFAESQRSFGFTVDYSVGRRRSPDSFQESHVEGAVGPRGTARWSEQSAGLVEEVIDLGNVVYRRSGAPDEVAEIQWSPSFGDDGLPVGGETYASAWAMPSTVAQTPIFARLTAGDIGRLLKAVRAPRLSSVHHYGDGPSYELVQGTLPLSALYRDIPEGFSGIATVDVKGGPDGRLATLALTVTTPRDTIDAAGRQTRATYQMLTAIRFEGWGTAGLVTAPPLNLIDLTPGIDEGAVTDLAWTVLAPREVPEGFELVSLWKSIGRCPVIWMEYAPVGGYDEEHYNSGAGNLSLRQSAAECSAPEAWEGGGRLGPPQPFTAGRFRGEIRQLQPQLEGDLTEEGLSYSEIHLHADGARLVLSGYLPDAVWRQTLATLAPIDFATQPVHKTDPRPGRS